MVDTAQNSRLQIRPVVYADARKNLLLTGDIALCHAATIEGRLISDVTKSPYTHAAMLGWAAADALMMMAETRQHIGSRLISLSGEVTRYPGYYDVYRVRRKFSPADAWSFMCHAAGSKYGWNHITRVWARRRLGCFISPIPNSEFPQWPRDCSALVHAALRAGGGPQVKTYDCDVVPGDLCATRYFDYVCTLFTSEMQIDQSRVWLNSEQWPYVAQS